MEQRVFILLFLTGVIPFTFSITRTYHLIKNAKPWTDAQAYCRATFTDLATVDSIEIMDQLQNYTLSQNFLASTWIGLYNDVDSWRWAIGNEPLGNTTRWATSQPDNRNSIEECGVVKLSVWYDITCTSTRPFVCFDDRNSGTDMYVYYSDYKTWSEAQSYCRQYHHDLASARDDAEISAIQAKITLTSVDTWIGLFRDSWKWSDHTPFTSVRWKSGEPDNYWQTEFCVFMQNGEVGDGRCPTSRTFFCQSVELKRQIFRMKVRSSQDVNVPVVKAAVLEKIQQKLKELGMDVDITVKWKEQPSGAVFLKIKEKSVLTTCSSFFYNSF